MKLVIELLIFLYCTVEAQTEPRSIVVAYLAIQVGHSKYSWPFMQPGSFSKGIAQWKNLFQLFVERGPALCESTDCETYADLLNKNNWN